MEVKMAGGRTHKPCDCVISFYWCDYNTGEWFLKDARADPDCCCYLYEEDSED